MEIFLLFPTIQKCYSQGTLNLTESTFFWKKPFRVFRKFIFKNIQKKFQEGKCSSPKFKQHFSVCDGIRLIFSNAEGFVLFQ